MSVHVYLATSLLAENCKQKVQGMPLYWINFYGNIQAKRHNSGRGSHIKLHVTNQLCVTAKRTGGKLVSQLSSRFHRYLLKGFGDQLFGLGYAYNQLSWREKNPKMLWSLKHILCYYTVWLIYICITYMGFADKICICTHSANSSQL